MARGSPKDGYLPKAIITVPNTDTLSILYI